MHELSIALSVIEGVEEVLASREGAQVVAVHLRLGPLSGVVKNALVSAYDLACEGTLLEGSRLIVEEIPVTIYCRRCEAERPAVSVQQLSCSVCNAPAAEVRGGTELEMVGVELQQ